MSGDKSGCCFIINGKTMVYGIIGCPVEHSFSPAMQSAALQAVGLNAVYVPFSPPPERLGDAVAGIRALGLAGANVTVPHKEAVKPFLDEITEEAVLYGAVNTIINRRGRLIGHNTDGSGFIKALQDDHGTDPQRGPVLIIGAGGAARAVALALVRAGCPELALVNRSRDKAVKLAEEMQVVGGSIVRVLVWNPSDVEIVDFAGRAILVVNCTSVGMSGGPTVDLPLPEGLPGRGQLAYDLVYNPPRTRFIERSSRNGAATANGLSMLLYQGVLAFEAWTGLQAPVEIMRRELHRQAGGA